MSALFHKNCYTEKMKKLSLYIFLGFFFLSTSFAYYDERFINKPYCGYLTYSDGQEYKVISKFYINTIDYTVFGIYTTKEHGEVFEGVFYKGKLKNNYYNNLTILTTDHLMHGKLNLKFGDNFNIFTGTWVGDDSKESISWDGKSGEFCKE